MQHSKASRSVTYFLCNLHNLNIKISVLQTFKTSVQMHRPNNNIKVPICRSKNLVQFLAATHSPRPIALPSLLPNTLPTFLLSFIVEGDSQYSEQNHFCNFLRVKTYCLMQPIAISLLFSTLYPLSSLYI
jgi:hypothetical protein